MFRILVVLMLLLLLLAPTGAPADDNWPAFRGGDRAGIGEGKTLPETRGTKKNIAWCVEGPGARWVSPIVWGDRVFVTSCVSKDKLRDPRPGLYIQDLQGKTPGGEHSWNVHCFNAKTGKELWKRTAFSGKMGSTIHLKNSLASETPVT